MPPLHNKTPVIPFDAIIFDFDGVLADSARIKTDAFRSLYAEHGADVLSAVLDYHAAHEGISRVIKIEHCHRELLGIDLDEAALAALVQQYQNIVEHAVIASAWIEGVREFLDLCVGKLPLIVASGTPEVELHRIVVARSMGHYFAEVRGSPDKKEAIVQAAAEHYEFDPASALFLGDAMTDYNAARSCGCRFIGVVAEGRENPFPDGTATVQNLINLEATF